MPSGLVVNDVKDTLTIASQILESAREEVVWLIPASINSLSIRYGFVEKVQTFIQGGGVSRGIVPISLANLEEIRLFLAVGEKIRHSDDVHELFMYVGDKQKSVSSINIGVEEFTLDTPVTAFWSESPEYAEYLLTAFEGAWSQAIPAEERIRELLEQQVGQS